MKLKTTEEQRKEARVFISRDLQDRVLSHEMKSDKECLYDAYDDLDAALARVKELERAEKALREIEDAFKRKGHHDTCSYSLNSEHTCDCAAYIANRYFAASRGEEKP